MNRHRIALVAALLALSPAAFAKGNPEAGKAKSTPCQACHGPAGKGNPALGAPNLTDNIWLYGSGEPVIMETIALGRNNQMPAHKSILSETKIHLLAGYVYSLSMPTPTPAK